MKKAPNYLIDYFTHPGFQFGIEKKSIPRIDEIFNEIDIAFEKINNAKLNKEQIAKEYSKEINPLFNEFEKIVLDLFLNEQYKSAIIRKIGEMKQFMLGELIDYASRSDKFVSALHPQAKEIYRQLKEEGIFSIKIDQSDINKLNSYIIKQKSDLEKKAETDPENLCAVSVPCAGKHWQYTLEILRKYKIGEAVTAFMGYKMYPYYFSLQVSHPGETWYQKCYADVNLPTSQTSYMHYDFDYDNLKVILYLSEVKMENGPFSILKRKSEWGYTKSRDYFAKFLDYANKDFVVIKNLEKGTYNRPFFKNIECRKEFLKLPVELQASSHFGDDILDGTDLSKELLNSEEYMLTEKANCLAFTGWQNIHRGGMVKKGKRWVVQIGFTNKPPKTPRKSFKRMSSDMYVSTIVNVKKILPPGLHEPIRKLYKKIFK